MESFIQIHSQTFCKELHFKINPKHEALDWASCFNFMEREFVTLEIAKLLKEVFFNEECFAYWSVKENGNIEEHFLPPNLNVDMKHNSSTEFISRPLWQQVFRWFRDVHGFAASFYQDHNNVWHWRLNDKCENNGEAETEENAMLAYVQRAVFKIQNPNVFEETVHERSLRLFQEYLDSPAADKWFEEHDKEIKIKEGRFEKFDEYLKTHEFKPLLERLIIENGDEWRGRCYNKGYEPYPTNKMQFLLDYVSARGEKQLLGSVDDNMFESELYKFDNYYFQLSQGQGCFWRIFDIDKEALLTI